MSRFNGKLSVIIFLLSLAAGMKESFAQKQGLLGSLESALGVITPGSGHRGRLEGLGCHLVVTMCIAAQSRGPHGLGTHCLGHLLADRKV